MTLTLNHWTTFEAYSRLLVLVSALYSFRGENLVVTEVTAAAGPALSETQFLAICFGNICALDSRAVAWDLTALVEETCEVLFFL